MEVGLKFTIMAKLCSLFCSKLTKYSPRVCTVWFASYEYAKTELTELSASNGDGSSSNNDIAIPMISGAFAATTAWAVGYPADLIKTRIQAGSGKGIIGTARDIVNESGGRVIHGLYKGFSLKLFRSIPASAIGFLTYETAAKCLTSK